MKEQTRRILRKLGPVGLLGLAWAIAPAAAGFYLLANIGTVSDWLLAQPGEPGSLGMGWAIYVGAFILAAGFGLLPTYAQAILGGWVFGLAWGLAGAIGGYTGAALLGYVVARSVARHRAEEIINESLKAQAIRDTLIGHGFWKTLFVVALLRAPPNSPFALTNLAMAATGVPIVSYIIGTVLGMTPRTAIAVALAAAARETGARDIQSFVKEGFGMWYLLGGVVLLFIVAGIIGAMANRALERINNKAAAPSAS